MVVLMKISDNFDADILLMLSDDRTTLIQLISKSNNLDDIVIFIS